ncbi:MAG: hypothetical protein IJK85_04930 [Bacteroidales bacterium]|nr:hypothetical protein [Bacteroidales bacterium]
MKNTYIIIVMALLLFSCGSSSKKATQEEPVSKEALLEQEAEEENLSEFERTQFVPTLEFPICSDTNAVYCATLLFAWDEVRKILDAPLSIPDKYHDLKLLNASTSFRDVLKSDEYEASGEVKGDYIFTRASFEKKLPFDFKLRKYEHKLKFDGRKVAAFGVDGDDHEDMKQIVDILYYKNDKNFIIKLKPTDKEYEIVLLKTEKKYGTMAEMTAATDSLIQLGKKERVVASKKWKYQFLSDDVVMVPDIDFDISASFDKLVGSIFEVNTETNTETYKILKAWQRTAFKLDEAGAEVKSEAEVVVVLGCIEQEEVKPTPKKMIFDKPFFVMLRRTDATNPYFCLYVANPELLVKE